MQNPRIVMFEELAVGAGVDVIFSMAQILRRAESKYLLGKGKAESIAESSVEPNSIESKVVESLEKAAKVVEDEFHQNCKEHKNLLVFQLCLLNK